VRQLERRLIKLEARAAVSSTNELESESKNIIKFLSSSELSQLICICGTLRPDLTLEQLRSDPAASQIILRSITRRELYPLLWLDSDLCHKDSIADPWSSSAEIETLRAEVAMNWLRKGLRLGLGELTPDDLTIVDRLRANPSDAIGTWVQVLYLATPNEIEPLLAHVQLDARSASWRQFNDFAESAAWDNVCRPLTWADLDLNPATFPWPVRREWEARTGRNSSWWRDGQWSLGLI
jgi:hypothetical protein